MGLLDFIARTGRGLGAAGRDVIGQMSGSTGPNDPSTFGGRFDNIVANEANPLGMVQAGQAFVEGFRGQQGTDPGRFAGATDAISQAASRTRPPGSVVARGYVGRQDRGPVTAGAGGVRGDARFTGGGLLNNTFGQPQPTGNYRMPGTGGRAEQMPVDDYVAQMPGLERPGGGGSARGQGAHVSGGDVSLAEHMARQRIRAGTER